MTVTNEDDLLIIDESSVHSIAPRFGGLAARPTVTQTSQINPGLISYSLDDIQAEHVEWLWQHRIPLGKLTLLVGAPDAGKSYVTIAIAAYLSRGEQLPGNPSPLEPCRSYIFELEDGLADTVLPRVELCNAVRGKIRVAQMVRTKAGLEVPFTLDDLSYLERELSEHPYIRMVVINPLTAVLPPHVNEYREQEVRFQLAKLDAIARKYNVAIIGVKHFNKRSPEQGGRGLTRVAGSGAFVAAVRSVLGIERDGDRRLLVPMKSNLSKRAAAVAFSIGDDGLTIEGEDPEYRAEGEAQPRESRLESCVTWLRGVLQDGPVASTQLQTSAADAGYGKVMLDRARARLRVSAIKGSDEDGKPTWFAALSKAMPSSEETRLECGEDKLAA